MLSCHSHKLPCNLHDTVNHMSHHADANTPADGEDHIDSTFLVSTPTAALKPHTGISSRQRRSTAAHNTSLPMASRVSGAWIGVLSLPNQQTSRRHPLPGAQKCRREEGRREHIYSQRCLDRKPQKESR
ncbi:hypothetical protein C8Q76DRAFT_744747 [Earliella scabrosa]|nr:hypothetical protein C8Q76DRAFT_744747 [Earliella scabrosa]